MRRLRPRAYPFTGPSGSKTLPAGADLIVRRLSIASVAALLAAGCPSQARRDGPPTTPHRTPADAGAPDAGPSDAGPPPPTPCGADGTAVCAPDQMCRLPPEANCGEADVAGICVERPRICTRHWAPVCGCDGRTYGNECSARAAGVSPRHEGPCPEP